MRQLDSLGGGHILRRETPESLPYYYRREFKRGFDPMRYLKIKIIVWESNCCALFSGMTFGMDKRNFDEIDHAGFGAFVKKNFDEIDR